MNSFLLLLLLFFSSISTIVSGAALPPPDVYASSVLAVRARLVDLEFSLTKGLSKEEYYRRHLPKHAPKEVPKAGSKPEDDDEIEEKDAQRPSRLIRRDVFSVLQLADSFFSTFKLKDFVDKAAKVSTDPFVEEPPRPSPSLTIPTVPEGKTADDPGYLAECKNHALAVSEWQLSELQRKINERKRKHLLLHLQEFHDKILNATKEAAITSGSGPKAAILSSLLHHIDRASTLEGMRYKKTGTATTTPDSTYKTPIDLLVSKHRTPRLFDQVPNHWRCQLLEAFATSFLGGSYFPGERSLSLLIDLLDDLALIAEWTPQQLKDLSTMQVALQCLTREVTTGNDQNRHFQAIAVFGGALSIVALSIIYYIIHRQRRRRQLQQQ